MPSITNINRLLAFANNPIPIEVDLRDLSIEEQIMLDYSVVMTWGTIKRTYNFSTVASNDKPCHIDLHNTCAAFFDTYNTFDWTEFKPNTAQSFVKDAAVASVHFEAYYYKDGTKVNLWTGNDSVNVLPGGLTEADRFIYGDLGSVCATDYIEASGYFVLSNKPREPELVNDGQYVTSSRALLNRGTQTVLVDTNVEIAGNDATPSNGITNVYVDDSVKRRQFVFINSYGVVESISAECLESEEQSVSTAQMSMTEVPAFVPKPHPINHSTPDKRRWKMSSGHTSHQWALWWANEFLAANYVAMVLDDGTLLPVHIKAEKVNVTGKVNAELPHVDFTVMSGY